MMMSTAGGRPQSQGKLVVRKSSLIVFLFIFALIGLHLRLTLYVGNTPVVPYYLFLFSTAIMVLMFRREILASTGAPLVALAVFVFLTPIFSSAPSSGYGARIISIMSFLVSIISAVGLYVALRSVPSSRLRRVVIATWVVFITLALLEGIGLKPVFDAIKDVIYAGSGRGVYDASDRDLNLYGQIRPTVLASEPSFLAYTLAALMFLAYVLHPNPNSRSALWQFFGMAAVSHMFAPSFTYAFYVIALATRALWPKTTRGFAAGLLVASGSCVLAFLFRAELSTIFLQLVGGHFETGSFFGRILVAPQAGLQVLAEWPLAGVGLGNAEAARPIVVQVWSDSGAFVLFPWFNNPLMRAPDLMSNGFWWQWIFFGVAGGIAFTAIIFWILHNLRVPYPARSILCCWIIWYPGAAFVDAGSWAILVIVSMSAANSARQRTATRMTNQPPSSA